MLESEYRRRYEHRYLLAVCYGFESGSYRYFGLAETDVAADESVHRFMTLHIVFYICRSTRLVGSIFVSKRRFEFGLHIAIGREAEPFLFKTFCV